MTGNYAGARGDAEVQALGDCAECKCEKERKRFCEISGHEIPKQCCICRGGHGCYWWNLCEACQEINDGWDVEE